MAAMNTLWVATDLTSTMRQSRATTAEASTGLPVESVVHSPTVKRSCAVSAVRPANALAIVSSPARKVLTQNTPLAWNGPVERLRRFRHTSNIAGASESAHTAVAVNPPLPPGPSVVTTGTAAPRRLMASGNVAASPLPAGGAAALASKAPAASSGRWSIQLMDSLYRGRNGARVPHLPQTSPAFPR